MKKGELKDLMKSFDTSMDVEVVGTDTLRVKAGKKTFERKLVDNAGISQALNELKQETDTYAFMNAFEPSEKASNKVDGKEGAKSDKKAKENVNENKRSK